MKKNTKELILFEAFKLFGSMTYEQVTYNELEAATGLTRGSVMYHYGTKEDLFKTMCDTYILNGSSVLDSLNESMSSKKTLLDFINQYIEGIDDLKKKFYADGVKNFNFAFINITNQATYYYPNFAHNALKWQAMQIQFWKNVIISAIKRKEIRADIDVDILADSFEDIYCGIAYIGQGLPDGIEIRRVRKAFYFLYNLAKI